MKYKWISQKQIYDGSQLGSLFAYMNYELQGDSIVSWQGPCDIKKDKIVDGEDLLAGSKICSSQMLHFIIEIYDRELFSAVSLQRLMASQSIELIKKLSSKAELTSQLCREGDDIYCEGKKLNISIATKSPTSSLIHFALNISNKGTPVSTFSLEDLGLAPKDFSYQLAENFVKEYEDIKSATHKVFWVK